MTPKSKKRIKDQPAAKNYNEIIFNNILFVAETDAIGKITYCNEMFAQEALHNSIHNYYDCTILDHITPKALLGDCQKWIGQLIHKKTHIEHAIHLSKVDNRYIWISMPTFQNDSSDKIEKIINLKEELSKLQIKEKKLQALLQEISINELFDQKIISKQKDPSLLSELPLNNAYNTSNAQAILANEERHRLSFEASKEGIWDWNHVSRKVHYSRQFFKMLGYETKENEGDITTLINLIWEEDRPTAILTLQRDIHIKDGFNMMFRMISANSTPVWVLLKAAVQKDINGKVTRVIGKHSDITFFKNQSDNIQKAVLKTEDKERERFAKEIHDGMGQTLTASLYQLDEAIKLIKKLDTGEKEMLVGIREQLRDAIKESRNIAHNIMPTAIEKTGYCGSIEKIANYYKDISDKELHFFHKIDQNSLSLSKQLILLRVSQESIHNAFKHGKAKNVSISINQNLDLITLMIEDDGIGFDVEKVKATQKKGIGLHSMQERVESIDGSLFIESSAKFGTCIIIELPVFKN
ncbi:PAS domain S-box protein [Flammeovirga pectinis]|uniref:histidine kinase n=1 Tax=Flammeovirga pectinis TaxID=2494373 RepID=A0A3Q9FQD7_9BACT|nr:ATP-binding protein [Flammeovirga pectinis]AZQ62373.1 PAS domain S-box protein [Flammeovirga pectinis]